MKDLICIHLNVCYCFTFKLTPQKDKECSNYYKIKTYDLKVVGEDSMATYL